MAAFCKHIKYVGGMLPHLLEHHVGRRSVRHARFHIHGRRLAAVDTISHRMLMGLGKKAVVVVGACQYSTGFRHAPVPMKLLLRRLKEHTQVVVIDEHYTSQMCSKCAFPKEGEEMKAKAMPQVKKEGGGTMWTVKRCKQCHTTWNRDVNAARNMRLLYLHMLRNGTVRPSPFKHAGALSQ